MLKSLTVKNYLSESITLELDRPEISGFIIENITGIGPEKATINITEIASRDGGHFNSSRKEVRNIVINLKFQETKELPSIEEVRHQTYKFFPLKRKVTLTFLTDIREVWIEGYVEANEPDIFNKSEGCQISILCPEPWFIGRSPQYSYASGHEGMFEFPFKNELIPLEQASDSDLVDTAIPPYEFKGSNNLTYQLQRSEGIIFGEIGKYKFSHEVFYEGTVETGFTMSIKLMEDLVEDPYNESENGNGYIVIRNPRYPEKKISVNLNKIKTFLPKCTDILSEDPVDGWYFLKELKVHDRDFANGYTASVILTGDYGVVPDESIITPFGKIRITFEATSTVHPSNLKVYFIRPTSLGGGTSENLFDEVISMDDYKVYHMDVDSDVLLEWLHTGGSLAFQNYTTVYSRIYMKNFKIYGKGEPKSRQTILPIANDFESDTVPVAQKGDIIKISTYGGRKGVWYSKPEYTYNSPDGEPTTMYWGRYEKGKIRSYKDEEFNILSAINRDAEWFQLGPGHNILEIYHTFHPNSEELLEEDADLVHADYLEVVVQNNILYEGV